MRKDAIAEWVLRLAMPRERATAAVGDLLEDSAGRDPSWFWTTLVWTIGSTVWREMQTHVWRLAGVATVGFFLLVILGLGANLAAQASWKILHFVRDHTGVELFLPGDSLPAAVPRWIALSYLRLLVPFEVARWVARRARGRELSAWVVMMLLWPVLAALTKSPYEFAWAALFAFLGVVCERWRTTRLHSLTQG